MTNAERRPGQGGRVLAVDDDPDLLRLLSLRLNASGYEVTTAESSEQALERLTRVRPQVVVTDLCMAGMDGMALFERIQSVHPGLPVIMLTAHGTIPDAVNATRRGIFGYLAKPFDGQALVAEVDRALRLSGPSQDTSPTEPVPGWRQHIISRGAAMEEVLRKAGLVAQGDASVLIQGASGTGKELLAQAVHLASPRREAAFVAVNCGAIPEPLLESELFGHVKGAFTGATRDHKGLILQAQGGTLFLDEIGDMPAALQVKLLRALQERQVRPIGGTQSVPVDLRVVSATHRDLRAEVAAGRFREDLYYRLNVVSLHLPSLADRREDIPLLAQHGLNRLAEKYGKKLHGLAPDALELLLEAPWPGNVRQLLNVLEQAVALATTPLIPASLLADAMRHDLVQLDGLEEAKRRFEKDYLTRLLQATQGNVSVAARLARRNRTEFYRLLHKHQLDPAVYKP